MELTPRDSVGLIQLVLDSTGYSRLRPSLGTSVTLTGRLFSAITGHHHAPVLMENVGIGKAGK